MKRSGCLPSRPVFASALFTLVVAVLAPAAPGFAAGSAEAGLPKAVVCAACHGIDGNSLNPAWPSLAGQNEAYVLSSLRAFKSGERSNVLMSSQTQALEDQDMQDLAAYFASKQRQGKTADPKLARAGERLYRGGNKESGIGACIACHGPNGSGNGPAAYPAIAGQHAAYTAAQLMAYRAGERTTDINQIMRNNTARLTDAEIDAVASYIQGLR